MFQIFFLLSCISVALTKLLKRVQSFYDKDLILLLGTKAALRTEMQKTDDRCRHQLLKFLFSKVSIGPEYESIPTECLTNFTVIMALQ